MSIAWLASNAILSDLDVAFARTLERLWPSTSPDALLGAALASWAVQQGHTALDLDRLLDDASLRAALAADERVASTDVDAIARALASAPFVARDDDVDGLPLVLEGSRVFLRRYRDYERELAQCLRERARDADDAIARSAVRLDASGMDADQARAAALALRSRLAVVCGGPGTGKTWTIVRLLAQLALAAGDAPLRIALAAPTGKAAMRLAASLASGTAKLDLPPAVRERLALDATTVHRLLGIGMSATRPYHDAARPLPLDVLVVDEASMLDLPLFTRLLRAVPDAARVVLVGDPEQLPAVEGGAVLSALASLEEHALPQVSGSPQAELPFGTTRPALASRIVRLRRTHRFAGGTALATLVDAVRRGDARGVRAALEAGGDVAWHEVLPRREPFASLVRKSAAGDASQALDALDRFRVLCALRTGAAGVDGLNTAIEQALGVRAHDAAWYRGRPLLVTANDHELGLYNGDTGVVWPDADGALRAWFRGREGLRALTPGQLPAHETGYAMTVHKAQGSEFDEVVLVLPREPHPLLTREWLYTAVSRAKTKLTVFAPFAVVEAALARRQVLMSGLAERLL